MMLEIGRRDVVPYLGDCGLGFDIEINQGLELDVVLNLKLYVWLTGLLLEV